MLQVITQKPSEFGIMPEKLRSETNTNEVAEEILKAATAYFASYRIYEGRISAVWDHDHWWVMFDDDDEDTIRTFDVTDCVSPDGREYIGFEEV